ncbi:MAG: iron-sulfur cluster assembly accessory protein [Melioribacteraceae bacterium]|nr:iron-sulfur cluster assembly accessory protein [Melioribacteraceae bacterium]MCF8355936.1 iron-sulfur cluster assembly accessory protein [Melioribacteraceae bacterium]MCF8395819.1 iron-sulfur cluster assembly accessory protein [Melioribacteraceae bacterium]MCF8420811.1 iron-sulfur cluster assembly accessory protein [Melioribacteraceae bacterium]
MSDSTLLQNDIDITDEAVVQLKKLMQESDLDSSYAVRVGVQGGGCSGMTYKLGFDSELKEGDTQIEINGIKLLVDGKSLFYLSGTVLDFSGGLNGKGFVFNNPNAARTCGCGESFGV